jgi:magnesium transporter
MISNMIGLYMSNVSNRMNETMKFLTLVATIFLPITFITGVFGMNFIDIPGLKWAWGFAVCMVSMGVIALWMLVYFRIKKWL